MRGKKLMDNIVNLERQIINVSGKEEIKVLNELAKAYLHVLPEKTLEYGARALELASRFDHRKGEAIALRNIGAGHTVLGDNSKAKNYYFKSLKIAERIDYKEGIANCFNSIAAVYNRLSDNELALEFYLKSMTIYEEIGNKRGVGRVLNNIGAFYYQVFSNYEKALEYYLKAMNINKEVGNKLAATINLSNIGEVYVRLNNYEKGLQYSLESLRMSEEIDNKRGIVLSLTSIGDIYFHWEDNDRALETFIKALDISKEVGDKYLISSCLINIEKAFRAKGDYTRIIKYLEESLELAKEIGEKDLFKDIYESFSESYSAIGNYQKALVYHKLYSEMLCEVFNDASSKQIAEMQTKYETEKKEKEAEIYRLRNVDLVQANEEIEKSLRNLTTLSNIGQMITATLDLEKIFNTVYDNVNTLMDASVFGIGIYKGEQIEFKFFMEESKRLPVSYTAMDDDNSYAVWCINNNKDVYINNAETEYSRYISSISDIGARKAQSIIYLPLKVEDRIIGVFTVQSFERNSYKNQHLDILKTLASYTAIALDNSNAHNRLKEMQNQIIRQEKMASLGQLVAGIAHEINNPVNFISSGLRPLKDRINEIFLLLDKYKELEPIGDSKELADLTNQIYQLKREISFETTVSEIEELIETISDGANRTAKIVRDLQHFSRDKKGVIENININKHIDSTLNLLRNQYKNRIKILKEYNEDLMIECYSGQINQVLLNILSNAIQAIEDVGEIRIRTYGDDKYIFIVVSDTGKGIAEGDILRIFDPFFTTKDVGKGTGLGLSISYEIIKSHRGDIEVKSELGKGSEFTIKLPVRQD